MLEDLNDVPHRLYGLWLRLKRCSPDQLRHASDREAALAEAASQGATPPWTFHSILQGLDIYDDFVFRDGSGPPCITRSSDGAPGLHRRGRSRTPAREVQEGSVQAQLSDELRSQFRVPAQPSDVVRSQSRVHGNPQTKYVHRPVAVPLPSDDRGRGRRSRTPSRQQWGSLSEPKEVSHASDVPEPGRLPSLPPPSRAVGTTSATASSTSVNQTNLRRIVTDPSYDPTLFRFAFGQGAGGGAAELQQQPSSKRQTEDFDGIGPLLQDAINFHDMPDYEQALCTIEVPFPGKENEWKRMRRDPTAWLVKAMRKQEVSYGKLDRSERLKFDEAKEAEVIQWVREAATRRVEGAIPQERIMRMRWVLTYKESGSAKARIAVVGFEDPAWKPWCPALLRCDRLSSRFLKSACEKSVARPVPARRPLVWVLDKLFRWRRQPTAWCMHPRSGSAM